MPNLSIPDRVDVGQLAAAFGARPEISARSVLVTMFGDSVVPTGGEIWLGDLIELCTAFGFNERLVRTSMYRLAGENYFEIERVGRRSRYRLTAAARREFAEAERRIYHRSELDWDGTWTMVFLDAASVPESGERLAAEADDLACLLDRNGYVPLSDGLFVAPQTARSADLGFLLADRAGDRLVPVAHARFEQLDALVRSGWLTARFKLEDAARRHRRFVQHYRWATALIDGTATKAAATGTDEHDFLLRTMVVHEWRRARLADPDLPAALLPPRWPAVAAAELAGRLYHRLSPGAWRWLQTTSALATAPSHTDRFGS